MCEVAIPGAKLQDNAPIECFDMAEDALNERIAFERAAVMSGDAVPLFGNTIRIGCTGYMCPSLEYLAGYQTQPRLRAQS